MNQTMGHTPGPWKLKVSYKPIGYEILYQDTRHNRVNNDAFLLFISGIGCTQDNANLIAATPELLEACKEAEQFLFGDKLAIDIMKKLRYAIAKAESKA